MIKDKRNLVFDTEQDDNPVWFSPNQISGAGTVEQLKTFILPNFYLLSDGDWPIEPTGYVNSGKGNRNRQAPYINAEDLIAELNKRMDKIVDSISLVLYYTESRPVREIARLLHYPDQDDLWYEMEWMLKFIAGKRAKEQRYRDWKNAVMRKRAERAKCHAKTVTWVLTKEARKGLPGVSE